MFIADIYNHRIRRITRDGIIDTVAGGAYGFSGDGGSALQAARSSRLPSLQTPQATCTSLMQATILFACCGQRPIPLRLALRSEWKKRFSAWCAFFFASLLSTPAIGSADIRPQRQEQTGQRLQSFVGSVLILH